MNKAIKKRRVPEMDDAAIAKYYDDRKNQPLFEFESDMNGSKTVMVQVPRSLLSDVMKLIDKKKKKTA